MLLARLLSGGFEPAPGSAASSGGDKQAQTSAQQRPLDSVGADWAVTLVRGAFLALALTQLLTSLGLLGHGLAKFVGSIAALALAAGLVSLAAASAAALQPAAKLRAAPPPPPPAKLPVAPATAGAGGAVGAAELPPLRQGRRYSRRMEVMDDAPEKMRRLAAVADGPQTVVVELVMEMVTPPPPPPQLAAVVQPGQETAQAPVGRGCCTRLEQWR